jgi:hypothetical protein
MPHSAFFVGPLGVSDTSKAFVVGSSSLAVPRVRVPSEVWNISLGARALVIEYSVHFLSSDCTVQCW